MKKKHNRIALDCRGKRNRKSIVQNYDIEPVSNIKLLKGQSDKSDAGYPLIDHYYVFSYKKKGSDDPLQTLICGSHVAKHFSELIDKKLPSLFNPLIMETVVNNGNLSEGLSGEVKDKTHPETKLLCNAIDLLIACWGTRIYGPLLDIRVKKRIYNYRPPSFHDVNFLNTYVLAKDSQKRSLQDMVQELRKNGNKIREFDFNPLSEILTSKGVNSFFG